MASSMTFGVLLGLVLSRAEASHPPVRWRFLHAEDPDQVAFVPGNLTAGAVAAFDQRGTAVWWGPCVGAELFTGVWRRLAWTAAELQVAFYRPCHDTGTCGLAGDMFVGSRLGVVAASDRRRLHLLTLSGGIGWGSVGRDWGGRDPARHGLTVAPRARYTFGGLVGIEVQVLLPGYAPGGAYPMAATIGVVGLPLLVLSAKGASRLR